MEEVRREDSAIIGELTAWINEGGWRVFYYQETYEPGMGVESIRFEANGVHVTFAGGEVFDANDVRLELPYRSPQLNIKLPRTEAPAHRDAARHEWVDALVIVAPAGDTHRQRLRHFEEGMRNISRQHALSRETGKRENLAADIKSRHPCLRQVRVADGQAGRVVEVDLPDGTTLTLRVVEVGGEQYEPGLFHLAIDDIVID